MKRLLLPILGLCLALALPMWRDFWDPDEGRYAQAAATMAESGDWVTPTVNQVIFLHKPPLVLWMVAASFKLLGTTAWAGRIGISLAGWGLILIFYWFVRRWRSEAEAQTAAIILATSPGWLIFQQIINMDFMVQAWITLAVMAFWMWHSTGLARWKGGFWVCCGLGFLSKGLIGMILPLGVVALFVVWERQWLVFFRLFKGLSWIFALALPMPWLILAARDNPDFFQIFFLDQQVLRFLTEKHSRNKFEGFFFLISLGFMAQWWLFLPGWSKAEAQARSWQRFAWSWALMPLAFFTLSKSKLPGYILPVLPPLAILIGAQWQAWMNGSLKERLLKARLGLGVLVSVAFFGMLVWEPALVAWAGDLDPETYHAVLPMVRACTVIGIGILGGAFLLRFWRLRTALFGLLGTGTVLVMVMGVAVSPSLDLYYSTRWIEEHLRYREGGLDHTIICLGRYRHSLALFHRPWPMVWGRLDDYNAWTSRTKGGVKVFFEGDQDLLRYVKDHQDQPIYLVAAANASRRFQDLKPPGKWFYIDGHANTLLYSNQELRVERYLHARADREIPETARQAALAQLSDFKGPIESRIIPGPHNQLYFKVFRVNERGEWECRSFDAPTGKFLSESRANPQSVGKVCLAFNMREVAPGLPTGEVWED